MLTAISSERQWLKLVHYEPDSGSPSGWTSAIHSSEFFLSADGRVDPMSELQATLSAFEQPAGADPDQHAQCRFPARLQWLRSRLQRMQTIREDISCPALQAWTKSGTVSSLSVVFATGFLGNPASYYGHTLLKFTFGGYNNQGRLMDVSVNYGAILEGNNDALPVYLVKSLLGGYDAGFSHIHFYFHNHNYGDSELRDLWEYRLQLPKQAVDMIVAHSWEVIGKRYTYYFFRSNCAYRMAEIIEVVDGVQFIPENRPWIIPQALVQNLALAQYRGEPLLAEVIYHPSRQSRFYEKLGNLSEGERAGLRDIVEHGLHAEAGTWQSEPITSQKAILDAAIDYYQFVANPLKDAPENIKRDYANALSARYRLPPDPLSIQSSTPESPDKGRSPGWVQVGFGHNSVLGKLTSIRMRPAYYDVIDAGSGHVTNGGLSMGDVQVDIRDGRPFINKVDVVSIESVNPGLSGLRGDNGAAWKLKFGAEQLNLSCGDCLVARAQGDIGAGRRWTRNLFSAAYIGGVLQGNRNQEGSGFARISGAAVYRPSNRTALSLLYEYRLSSGSSRRNYSVLKSEGRWAISPRSDLRLGYQYDGAYLTMLGVGGYW